MYYANLGQSNNGKYISLMLIVISALYEIELIIKFVLFFITVI